MSRKAQINPDSGKHATTGMLRPRQAACSRRTPSEHRTPGEVQEDRLLELLAEIDAAFRRLLDGEAPQAMEAGEAVISVLDAFIT